MYLQKIASSFGVKIKNNLAAIDIQRIKMTASEKNQGVALYIINSEGIAYHQHAVLHLIKPQEKYTLARDEIQPQRG